MWIPQRSWLLRLQNSIFVDSKTFWNLQNFVVKHVFNWTLAFGDCRHVETDFYALLSIVQRHPQTVAILQNLAFWRKLLRNFLRAFRFHDISELGHILRIRVGSTLRWCLPCFLATKSNSFFLINKTYKFHELWWRCLRLFSRYFRSFFYILFLI